jgi:hypothetical protein
VPDNNIVMLNKKRGFKMGAVCKVCSSSGTNIVKCKACGKIYCKTCSSKGKGAYPKNSSSNKCSYCGKLNTLENYEGASTKREVIEP